jgi:predicted RNase H-like nuclease (RuvC/YqgF family)
VIDQLTKVLVGLYEEPDKPNNAIDHIKKCLGAPSDTDVEQLKQENEDLKRQMAELEKKYEDLHNELDQVRQEQS